MKITDKKYVSNQNDFTFFTPFKIIDNSSLEIFFNNLQLNFKYNLTILSNAIQNPKLNKFSNNHITNKQTINIEFFSQVDTILVDPDFYISHFPIENSNYLKNEDINLLNLSESDKQLYNWPISKILLDSSEIYETKCIQINFNSKSKWNDYTLDLSKLVILKKNRLENESDLNTYEIDNTNFIKNYHILDKNTTDGTIVLFEFNNDLDYNHTYRIDIPKNSIIDNKIQIANEYAIENKIIFNSLIKSDLLKPNISYISHLPGYDTNYYEWPIDLKNNNIFRVNFDSLTNWNNYIINDYSKILIQRKNRITNTDWEIFNGFKTILTNSQKSYLYWRVLNNAQTEWRPSISEAIFKTINGNIINPSADNIISSDNPVGNLAIYAFDNDSTTTYRPSWPRTDGKTTYPKNSVWLGIKLNSPDIIESVTLSNDGNGMGVGSAISGGNTVTWNGGLLLQASDDGENWINTSSMYNSNTVYNYNSNKFNIINNNTIDFEFTTELLNNYKYKINIPKKTITHKLLNGNLGNDNFIMNLDSLEIVFNTKINTNLTGNFYQSHIPSINTNFINWSEHWGLENNLIEINFENENYTNNWDNYYFDTNKFMIINKTRSINDEWQLISNCGFEDSIENKNEINNLDDLKDIFINGSQIQYGTYVNNELILNINYWDLNLNDKIYIPSYFDLNFEFQIKYFKSGIWHLNWTTIPYDENNWNGQNVSTTIINADGPYQEINTISAKGPYSLYTYLRTSSGSFFSRKKYYKNVITNYEYYINYPYISKILSNGESKDKKYWIRNDTNEIIYESTYEVTQNYWRRKDNNEIIYKSTYILNNGSGGYWLKINYNDINIEKLKIRLINKNNNSNQIIRTSYWKLSDNINSNSASSNSLELYNKIITNEYTNNLFNTFSFGTYGNKDVQSLINGLYNSTSPEDIFNINGGISYASLLDTNIFYIDIYKWDLINNDEIYLSIYCTEPDASKAFIVEAYMDGVWKQLDFIFIDPNYNQFSVIPSSLKTNNQTRDGAWWLILKYNTKITKYKITSCETMQDSSNNPSWGSNEWHKGIKLGYWYPSDTTIPQYLTDLIKDKGYSTINYNKYFWLIRDNKAMKITDNPTNEKDFFINFAKHWWIENNNIVKKISNKKEFTSSDFILKNVYLNNNILSNYTQINYLNENFKIQMNLQSTELNDVIKIIIPSYSIIHTKLNGRLYSKNNELINEFVGNINQIDIELYTPVLDTSIINNNFIVDHIPYKNCNNINNINYIIIYLDSNSKLDYYSFNLDRFHLFKLNDSNNNSDWVWSSNKLNIINDYNINNELKYIKLNLSQNLEYNNKYKLKILNNAITYSEFYINIECSILFNLINLDNINILPGILINENTDLENPQNIPNIDILQPLYLSFPSNISILNSNKSIFKIYSQDYSIDGHKLITNTNKVLFSEIYNNDNITNITNNINVNNIYDINDLTIIHTPFKTVGLHLKGSLIEEWTNLNDILFKALNIYNLKIGLDLVTVENLNNKAAFYGYGNSNNCGKLAWSIGYHYILLNHSDKILNYNNLFTIDTGDELNIKFKNDNINYSVYENTFTSSSLKLGDDASNIDNFYSNWKIIIITGNDKNKISYIKDYNGNTKIFTIDDDSLLSNIAQGAFFRVVYFIVFKVI